MYLEFECSVGGRSSELAAYCHSFRVCGWLFVVALLVLAAFADTNEDPHELLSKSFQQADLWSHDPVKLVARVHVDNPDGRAQNLRYVVYWDGPEKWRGEWSAPGRKQITIVNNGKLSYSSNQPKPLWSTIWFEAALAAVDGGTPAGPYLLPYIRNSNLSTQRRGHPVPNSLRRYLPDHATPATVKAALGFASVRSRAVKIAGTVEDYIAHRIRAVIATGKVIQRGIGPGVVRLG